MKCYTVDSRLRLSRLTAYLEEKIWYLFERRNLTSGNKILWIRGEIAPPKEQFLPFPTIFSIYISNYRSLITAPILRIGDQVLTFDVFWSKHLQEVRSTAYIHVQSI